MLSEISQHDADLVGPLLEQLPLDIETFRGEGAYTQWDVCTKILNQTIWM